MRVKKKSWNFENILKDELKDFSHKIKYHKIKIDLEKAERERSQNYNNPLEGRSWKVENMQRNYIKEACKEFSSEDIIIVSDLDEIPSKEKINFIKSSDFKAVAPVAFEQALFHLNCKYLNLETWIGSVVVTKELIDKYEPQIFRDYKGRISRFKEAGWSFSSFGGIDKVKEKFEAFVHQEYNKKEFLNAEHIKKSAESGLDLLKDHWEAQSLEANFAIFWRKTLHDGVMAGTQFPQLTPKLRKIPIPAGFGKLTEEDVVELQLLPDPMIDDGRFANNGWLQESPRPISLLTWDNAALVSPKTAKRLRLKKQRMADFRLGELSLKLPVWILPGQAENVITVHTGFGQKKLGRVANEAGFNAYLLSTTEHPTGNTGLEASATFEEYNLACTQDHSKMTDGYERTDELGTSTFEDRKLIRESTFAEYKANPDFAHEGVHDPADDMTLYNREDHKWDGAEDKYAWGMVIDLTVCGGCNACAIACQSENNIPVVGKEQVLNGREMSWVRIDRYFKGEIDDPRIVHQPVACMHCENAPCEVVCPVAATVHSKEGLNSMIYNRCVGTRYCANNCPYKVRRFNFLQYSDRETESLKLQRNPNVTVRSRGVMEKCTYCVQRINQARIEAKKSGNPIKDGDVCIPCENACPSDAIVFGNINDSESRVSKYKSNKLNYGILTDLNTRPRTTYLAAIRNPNPEIEV